MSAAIKDELLKLWSLGKADIHDVMEILLMLRADVMYAAIYAGYELQLDDDDDAEEKNAAFARVIATASDDGTRH